MMTKGQLTDNCFVIDLNTLRVTSPFESEFNALATACDALSLAQEAFDLANILEQYQL